MFDAKGAALRGGAQPGATVMTPVELGTPDGCRLAGRLYSPAATAHAAVLIGPAMGVAQNYYAAFATWLAEQGYLALSFDYRGMGDSRPSPAARSLRGFKADLFDWVRDFDTAIEYTQRAAPGLPLYVVGHSLGAQLPGMLRQRDGIAGLVSIAAGSGYWRDNAPPLKRVALYFWHLLVPVATALCGTSPASVCARSAIYRVAWSSNGAVGACTRATTSVPKGRPCASSSRARGSRWWRGR